MLKQMMRKSKRISVRSFPGFPDIVKEVRVSDNQVVKKGDTLLILDDRDMRIKVGTG